MIWLLRRIGQAIPLIWGLISLLFLLFQVLGDPVRMMAGQRSDLSTLESIRAEFRLDKPIWQQYLWYINDISPIGLTQNDKIESQEVVLIISGETYSLSLKRPDLGISFQTRRPVLDMISDKLPGTLVLAISAMTLAIVLGIGFGVIAAVNKDSFWDRCLSLISMLGVSTPSFVAAVILIWVFVIVLGDYTGLPLAGYWVQEAVFSDGSTYRFGALILPSVALGVRPLSVIMQLTRSSMLEVAGQDYIRTARAKGLKPVRVWLGHALPNALNPVISSISGWFASLLAGVFFIEFMFDWQGLGRLTMDALQKSDYPVLSGCILFVGFIFIFMNMLTDVLYRLTDPRVQLES
jgi:peptide/nickel transport system permease protein